MTTHTRFQKLCLDPDVLQVAIRNRGDIRNDWEDNSTWSFRKASYRQYVLDRYRYLGKGNRRVCPSCVFCENCSLALSFPDWGVHGIQAGIMSTA